MDICQFFFASKLCPKLTGPTFYGSQKEDATQKLAKVKWLRKRKGEGQEKNLERVIPPNFGLCACTKLKQCKILYLIQFGKSIFCKKRLFQQNLGPFSVIVEAKTDITVKNGIFFQCQNLA